MVNPRPNPHLYVEAGVIYHDDVRPTPDGPAKYTRSIGTVEKITVSGTSRTTRWVTRSMGGVRVGTQHFTRQAAIEAHDRLYHEARRNIARRS